MSGNADWTSRYGASVMNTFGTPQRVLVRGEGVHVWDADGTRYLDLLGGSIAFTSTPGNTTFTVELPQRFTGGSA